ncbi:MAG: hypothetical protein M1596_03035 [Firmicutes bacterium]|nr:hypothetical protein [Bacillota bacterium]
MLSRAFSLWRVALRSQAVRSAAIWNAIFSCLFLISTDMANPLMSALLFPQADSHLELQLYHPHLLALRNFLVLITAVVVGPWVFSGVYGLLGQVIVGDPIRPNAFVRMAKIFYGKVWGFFLFIWIWMLGLALVGFVVLVVLHGFGFFVVVIVGILSLPGVVRMTGGLFVNRFSWTDSFSEVFNRSGYVLLLIGTVLGLLASTMLGAIGFVLMATPARVAPFYLIAVVLSVALPLWLFALYRVTTPLTS